MRKEEIEQEIGRRNFRKTIMLGENEEDMCDLYLYLLPPYAQN